MSGAFFPPSSEKQNPNFYNETNRSLVLQKSLLPLTQIPNIPIDDQTSFYSIGTETCPGHITLACEGATVNYRNLFCSDINRVSGIDVRRSRGNFSNPLPLQSGDTILGLVARGFTGTTWNATVSIDTVIDGAVSPGVLPQGFRLRTGASGVATRFRVFSDGNISIGMGDTKPNARLQITGGVAISGQSSAVANPGSGNLSVSGTANIGGVLKTSGRASNYTTKNANYTATNKDEFIFVDATNPVTISLPTAINNGGMKITVIKIDSSNNMVTVTPVVAKGILSQQYQSQSFVSNNSVWIPYG